MGKLLVTGSLGNAGGFVAKHAITNGLDVVVADIDVHMMTRLGSAKQVTGTYEALMGKRPTDFRSFVRKNRDAWVKSSMS